MQYQLSSLCSNRIVDIDEEKFNQLVKDYTISVSALLFEESIDVVLSNHMDYEFFLLNTSLSTGFKNQKKEDLSMIRIEINRLLSNVLSTIYNYTKYGDSRIDSIISGSIFSGETKRLEKENKIFKFMSELRNYVQHYDFLTHSVTLDKGWKVINGIQKNHHSIRVFVNLEQLINDEKFTKHYKDKRDQKARVDAISAFGNAKADLTPLVREYIDCLWELHKTIRKKIEMEVNTSKKNVAVAVDSVSPTNRLGAYLIKKDINNLQKITMAIRVLEEHSLLYEKYLLHKTSNLFVSNQYIDPNNMI